MSKHKNKNISYLCFLAIFLGGIFVWPNTAGAAPTDIVISEIMYDAVGSDTDTEWVEIYNSSTESITITDGSGTDSWRFNDGSNHTFTIIQGSLTIPPAGAAIIASNGAKFLETHSGFSGTIIDTVMSLNNTSDTLKLSADKGATFFGEITYQNTWGGGGDGKTLEKINLTGDNSQSNWHASSIDGGTPGSVATEPTPPPSEPAATPPPTTPSAPTPSAPTATAIIKINEVYPNPKEDNEQEFVELCNKGNASTTLSGWKLADTKKVINLPEVTLVSNECRSFDAKTTKITLNNSNETIYLYNPSGEVADKLTYASSVKGQSLSWDETQNKFLWSAKPTPGRSNEISKINEPPLARITFDYNPAAVNEEVIISAEESIDPDDDLLQFSWQIGESFQAAGERFAYHFSSLGEHLVSLTTSDGQHAVLATSSISILPAEEILSRRSALKTLASTPNKTSTTTPATTTAKTVSSKKQTSTTQSSPSQPKAGQPLADNPHPASAEASAGRPTLSDDLIDVDLANIRELELSSFVRVQGTVAVPPGVLAKTYFYITGSPGIQVYFSKKDWPKLEVGDVIGVLGELTETGGELRLKVVAKQDIVQVYKGKPPVPTEAETGEIGEELEGALIKASGELTEKKGTSWIIDDGSGEAKITFQTAAKIKKPTIKAGEWVEVTGLVSETKSGFRVLPRYSSDVRALEEKEVADKTGAVLGEATTNNDALARFRIPANNEPQIILKYLLITSIALIILLVGLLIKFRIETKKRLKEIQKRSE